jgi:HEAT repeat protein
MRLAGIRVWGPLLVIVAPLAITVALYRQPALMLRLAAGVLGITFALVLAVLLVRRLRPRGEQPTLAQLREDVHQTMGRRGAREGKKLLVRLGRWPELIYQLGPHIRHQVVERVQGDGLAPTLARWMTVHRRRARQIGAIHLSVWLGFPDLEGKLEELAGSEDQTLAHAAAAALARIGSEAAYDALMRLIGSVPLPASRIAALLEGAAPGRLIPVLRRHVSSPDGTKRFWVASLAGVAGSERALQILLTLSADPVLDVRAAAAESLGLTGDEGGRQRLHEMLTDESWVVQSHATKALGRLGPERSIKRLVPLLESPHRWVREHAVVALGDAGPLAVLPLQRVLHNAGAEVRSAAAAALVRTGFLSRLQTAPPTSEAERLHLADELTALEAAGAGSAIPGVLWAWSGRALEGHS